MRSLLLIIAFTGWVASSCQQPKLELTVDEAKQLAEEAYIFAYPMIEHYKMMFVMAIYEESGAYEAPFNVMINKATLSGPKDTVIVRPNNDTFYSAVWLDLSEQPQILKVPEIPDGRYYSFQIIDMYTHNVDYIGSRKTGMDSGAYMFVGPNWEGEVPKNISKVIPSEGNYLIALGRTQVFGPEDSKQAQAIMKGYQVVSLKELTGSEADNSEAKIPSFPPFDPKRAGDVNFISYLNALMTQGPIHPDEQDMFKQFAKIGIKPGKQFDPDEFSSEIISAINEGIESGMNKITQESAQLGERRNGWQLVTGAFGTREAMKGKYLKRAAAAYFGLWGNDLEEAFYPEATFDSEGEELDGSNHSYILHFDKDEIPPVNAFWSISMYKLPEQLFIENEINRYRISSANDLKYNDDGSLDLFIQKNDPGKDKRSNWLPAFDGPFSLQARLYWPEPQSLDPLYNMPPVVKNDE